MKSNKIVISCPILKKDRGGVSNYFSIVKNYLDPNRFLFFENDVPSRSYIKMFFFGMIEAFRFTKIVFRSNVKVVHLNPSLLPRAIIRDSVFLLISKLFKKKVLIFWRGWNSYIEKLVSSKYLSLFSSIFKRADLTLVLSNDYKEKLQNLGINHPIFTMTTLYDPRLATGCIKTYNDHPQKLLFMARLIKEKGIYETIEAYLSLRNTYRELILNIAGDGDEFQNLIKQYGSQNGIIFHGWVEDKRKYELLSDSDIFILPSSHGEGMPNSLLEAMACGLPVITCPIGGIRDFFQPNINGYFTYYGDSENLSYQIEKILLNKQLYLAISNNNRKFAEKYFSAPNAVQRLDNIYHSLIANKLNNIPTTWL